MITVYSEKHRLHDAKTELYGGTLVPPYERPSRAEIVLQRVQSEQLGEVITPKEFGRDPVLTLHDAGFVEFLRVAWDECSKTEYEGGGHPHLLACVSDDPAYTASSKARWATTRCPRKPPSVQAPGKPRWRARMWR